ncbi:Protein ENDOSPERM DEFECTIVE 1 [Striga hermonthica]|uniref:Protein ENDOSPERM DEFECTIVE 1 n=1 Tax=Striga hermonthica TaxID=68872 RepID=A0A9N7NUV4_STRHE|nr:Protein ENDOSPERM DEFECTIVE 1 [Striga hermonthica]
MADPSGGTSARCPAAEQPAPPPPPPTHRRPRVREVSSRFMSPLTHSNSTPIPNPTDLPRSKLARHRHPPTGDENHAPEVNRSLDRPSSSSSSSILSTVLRKPHHHPPQRVRHPPQTGDPKSHPNPDARVSSRPDTPIATCMDRIVPSRYRQVTPSIQRSISLNSSGSSSVTTAARLLQEATSDVQKKLPRISMSSRDDSDPCSSTASNQGSSSCPNSPICVPSSKQRIVPDIRASMPDMDKWLTDMSFGGKVTGDCTRSLNFSSSSVKMGGVIALPPHPSSNVRLGLDSKKGRKGNNNQQEDVHSVRMLNNRYLQWRLANAKAEATARAQKEEAERKFFSLGAKLSDMRENVRRKRSELAVLRGIKNFTTIVEAQMPYLDEWDNLENEYSTSLLETTNALLSCSARLPVGGFVRADVGELIEALGSALKVIESIGSHTQRFTQEAEKMDVSVSELARVAGGEKALIEECGDLLSKTYVSQVKECSLRSTLVQVHNSNSHQKHKSGEDIL